MRCDSLMSEIVAGAVPMQSAVDAPFDDGAPGWSYTVEMGAGRTPICCDPGHR